MLDFFANKGAGGEYTIKPTGTIALIIILIALFAIIALIPKQKRTTKISTKQLVFSSICMALAVATSALKVFEAPMGGSITLGSMLFLSLIGYWYGPSIGFTAAFAYGFIQLFLHPYVISLPQMILDYILAFGVFGLSGLFANKKYGLIKGYVVCILARWICATLSGVIFFADYAGDQNVWAYSMSYNGFYIGIEAAVTIVLLLVPPFYNALTFVKKIALE